MKHIDADKLKAVIDAIDSLQQEQPELDCKSLMVGDWVFDTYTNKPMMIESINGGNPRFGQDLEPIPLTPEILEKNFPEPTDGLTWYPEEGGFNCHTYVPKCEINAFGLFKYVHQLQHAFILCGIDKNIEL